MKTNLKCYLEELKKDNTCEIEGKKRIYSLNKHTYGIISMDKENPLYCASISDNGISIDLWTGCTWGCRYCHAQGIYDDIKDMGKQRVTPIRRNNASIKDIVKELVNSNVFKKDKTIISIGTASTEPLGNAIVTRSTIDIINEFIDLGCKNPFWIITKAGIPDEFIASLDKVKNNDNKIIISVCWAGNPAEIEPVQNNRFKNIEKIADIENIHILWYLRPIVSEWGGNEENIKHLFEYVSRNYGRYIDCIVPGGLRWTEGIEYALVELHKQKLPYLIKDDNKKTLDSKIVEVIKKYSLKYFPNVPLFFNSSCALSYILNRNNIVMKNIYSKENCNKSICPNKQRKNCKITVNNEQLELIEKSLIEKGIKIKIKKVNNENIFTEPSLMEFNYSIKQIILREVADFLEG